MPDEVVEQPLDQVEDQAAYVRARTGATEVEKPAEEEIPEEKPAETAETEEEKPKNKGGGFQKRIERLAKIAKEAEERADRAERRAQELERTTPAKEQPKVREGEPKQEDYTDYEEYLIDKATYRLEAKQKAEREASERKSEEAKLKETFDAHNERVIAARAKYEDFDDVVNARTPWMEGTKEDIAASQAFQVALFEEENSAEILYHLGSHPEELAKFAGLSPAQVVKAVGRLADKISVDEPEDTEETEKEEEKPKRQPTVIRPVNTGSSRSSVSLDKVDSQAEYVRMRRAGKRR